MPISRGNPPNRRDRGKSDPKKVVGAEKVSTNGFFIAAVTFTYQGLRRGIISTTIDSGAISLFNLVEFAFSPA
jgi:hypothetical protein